MTFLFSFVPQLGLCPFLFGEMLFSSFFLQFTISLIDFHVPWDCACGRERGVDHLWNAADPSHVAESGGGRF